MVETGVLAPGVADRLCPVCGTGGKPHLFAESNFNASELDQFAFASRKLPEYMHWRLWECGQCDLLYANPAPTVERKRLSNGIYSRAFSDVELGG